MIQVAIIPARGGSVRIPRKNIRMFHGKPIIAYSIETARKSNLFDRIVVSTEDDEIADVAHNYGADVIMRSRALADDPAIGTQEVTAHALRSIPCEYACCIYACAPMLTAVDLSIGRKVMGSTEKWAYIRGWFYWGRSEWFAFDRHLQGDGHMWPHPHRHIDIDLPEDWVRAEQMYESLITSASSCARRTTA